MTDNDISPYIRKVLESPQTEAEARARRERDNWLLSLGPKLDRWKREDAAKAAADPLANKTLYTVWLAPTKPGEALWQPEWPMMTTKAEVLECLGDVRSPFRVHCIIQHDPDLPREDVTEKFAVIVKDRWIKDGNVLGESSLPGFCLDHLPADEDTGYRPRK